MRFLSIHSARETNTPPRPGLVEDVGRLMHRGFTEGWLISAEGCLPSALGARVRRDGTLATVTDGPFSETKEVVGGFAIFEAASKEEAVKLAHDFLAVIGDGACEIRPLYESSAPATSAAA